MNLGTNLRKLAEEKYPEPKPNEEIGSNPSQFYFKLAKAIDEQNGFMAGYIKALQIQYGEELFKRV